MQKESWRLQSRLMGERSGIVNSVQSRMCGRGGVVGAATMTSRMVHGALRRRVREEDRKVQIFGGRTCRQDTHTGHICAVQFVHSANRTIHAHGSRIALSSLCLTRDKSSAASHVSSMVVLSRAFLHELFLFLTCLPYNTTRTLSASRKSPSSLGRQVEGPGEEGRGRSPRRARPSIQERKWHGGRVASGHGRREGGRAKKEVAEGAARR